MQPSVFQHGYARIIAVMTNMVADNDAIDHDQFPHYNTHTHAHAHAPSDIVALLEQGADKDATNEVRCEAHESHGGCMRRA